MRLLSLDPPRGGRARYLRIAQAVRAAVRAGRARPGELLPSSRELAASLGVHRLTVLAALRELVSEGWLQSEPRRGYRVARELPDGFLRAASARGRAASAPHRFRLARSPGAEAAPPALARRFDLRSGSPDLRRLPMGELTSCLRDSLARSGPRLMGYGDPAGHPGLVEGLAEYLRRLRGVAGRPVIVTHGSQEGVFLAAQLLVAPGDAVAVEALGYPPAWSALRLAGGELVPVRVDAEGLDPDDLARAARRRRIRLLYTTPLHQYPTTATLPAARRLRLYELAARHGIVILEDDYDHEFHYRCQPPAPLAAADPDGRVVYVSSFSKALFPSARLGFMSVPAGLAGPLKALRRVVTRQNDFVMQDAIARWLRSGGLERHLRRMRRLYHERRDAFAAELARARAGGPRLSWSVPDGGMALWLDVESDSRRVAAAAARLGVALTPEAGLRSDGRPGTHLRLGFARHEPREAREGLALLWRALRTAR